MMHKRNITVGTILGAGLLGSLIAWGQDSPPRPRAIAPPPLGEVAPLDESPAKKIEPGAVPEVPPLPIFPDPKSAIHAVQYVEPKAVPKVPADLIDTLPKAPSLPSIFDVPVPTVPLEAPRPPVVPTNEILPPPMPPTPKIEPAKVPDPKSAPPTAWSPGDTSVPKEIRVPDAPPPPVYSTIESAQKTVPTVPVSNPIESPPEGTSRFVVPSRTTPTAPPTNQIVAPVSQPVVEQPAGPYRFQAVRTGKAIPEIQKTPGPLPNTLPKMTEVSRPTGSDLHSPTADPQSGALTPQLTIEKRGPLLHKVGGPLRYQIVLKNVGTIPAQQVRVEDEVPGAQLIATTPIITQQQGDRLVWIIASLRPGEERTFMEELQPVRSGDVVSTTSVHVYSSTSFRTKLDGEVIPPPIVPPPPLLSPQPPSLPPPPTIPTPAPSIAPPPFSPLPNPFASPPSVQGTPTVNGPSLIDPPPLNPNPPQLNPTPALSPVPTAPPAANGPIPMTVEVKAMPTVALRQTLNFDVIVSNKGPAPLSRMKFYVKVPNGFIYSKTTGTEIEADVPDMSPGDTKSYKIPLVAVTPGRFTVEIRVTSGPYELVARPVVTIEGGGLSIQQSASPMLQMNKDNEIKIVVANNQSTPLTQVQIVDVLPEGLDFVGASDRGVYQANSRTITWMLDSVPAGRARTISLRVQPKTNGSFPHEVIAKTEDLPEAKSMNVLQVEGFANVQVQIQGRDNPLEEGKDTVYQIRVTNVGSSMATNVQTSVILSPGLDATGFAQAPTAYRISGRDVIFAPIPRIQPGETKTITLGVRGVLSGQQSVRVQVVGDQLRTPATREERTQVYREK